MLSSIKKGTALIETLAGGHKEWSVLELAAATGMPPPTVHHFLASFRAAGWVTQDAQSKRYRLGVKLWEIGCSAVGFREVTESARPYLRELMERCGETAHLGMVAPEDPLTVMYIDRVDSPQPVRVITEIGSKAPSYSSAMGKAIIAHNSALQSAVLAASRSPVTEHTLVEERALAEDLAATRARGYSIARGEFIGEMVGIAAPVYDRFGNVTLGIGIWASSTRMTPEYIEGAAVQLRLAALNVSRRMGYMGAL